MWPLDFDDSYDDDDFVDELHYDNYDEVEPQAHGKEIYKIETEEKKIIIHCKNPKCQRPIIIMPNNFCVMAPPEYCKTCYKVAELSTCKQHI
jgi:hypothetical protein